MDGSIRGMFRKAVRGLLASRSIQRCLGEGRRPGSSSPLPPALSRAQLPIVPRHERRKASPPGFPRRRHSCIDCISTPQDISQAYLKLEAKPRRGTSAPWRPPLAVCRLAGERSASGSAVSTRLRRSSRLGFLRTQASRPLAS